MNGNGVVSYRNSTSNHNSRRYATTDRGVVSYRNSTSNHNSVCIQRGVFYVVSYRNSTSNHNKTSYHISLSKLYLIEILHQTTTRILPPKNSTGCILSKFYIKPQQRSSDFPPDQVVSYRNSTSNHNGDNRRTDKFDVVSYRNSTSNHNTTQRKGRRCSVVSYRNSTSNHN